MRILIALAAATLFLTACGGDAKQDVTRDKGKTAAATSGPIGAPSAPTSRLDFASCLAEDVADDEARAQRCPSFALLSLDYMSSQCSAHGGKLIARQPSKAWSLDVDGDASAEVLVDLIGNFDCEGAPGAFACGSTGCPFLLYKKRDETWVELGAINADDAPAIEVLPAEEGKLAHCAAAASASSPAASTRITSGTGASTRAPGSTSRATPSTSHPAAS